MAIYGHVNVPQAPHEFSARELARLKVYRLAIRAGFYTDEEEGNPGVSVIIDELGTSVRKLPFRPASSFSVLR